MAAHVAFLRGMNIGGRRITNADLAEAFAGLGFDGVGTYRASGNVFFADPDRDEAALVAAIEKGLDEALGYAVPTFVRSAAEVRAIAELEPFDPDRVAASGGKLQVSVLGSKPAKRKADAVLALAGDEDLLAFAGRELYWLPSGGLLDSDLDLDAIDDLLGPSTRRTKGTIEGIAAKLAGADG